MSAPNMADLQYIILPGMWKMAGKGQSRSVGEPKGRTDNQEGFFLFILCIFYVYFMYIMYILRYPGGSVVRNSSANAGDVVLIPGSGRSPGKGNGNPHQCSCLENAMDRGTWWAGYIVHGAENVRLND